MNAFTLSWRLLCTLGVILGLAGPGWAADKDKKDSDKGKDEKKVIVIQLDVSKAPPALIKQLTDLAKGQGAAKKDDDDDDKKKGSKKDDDDKKKDTKKGGDVKATSGGTKSANLVQVDLNKLSPDLAKRLVAELAKSKAQGEAKKGGKKDDDDDKKKGGKKDDDDDKKKKGGKKDDDDDDKKKSGKK